jgi:Transposase IS116/IS110/IS902 family
MAAAVAVALTVLPVACWGNAEAVFSDTDPNTSTITAAADFAVGRLKVFGTNGTGQLGLGDTTSRAAPVPLSDGTVRRIVSRDARPRRPGLGVVLGARVLAEFGDSNTRYADARARKNYAGTSPVTRQSGKKKLVMARYVHNDRLVDALGLQAFAALRSSPGARRYYDQLRARGIGHRAALRQLGNRLVGILHGCLTTGTAYDKHIAWTHQQEQTHAAARLQNDMGRLLHREDVSTPSIPPGVTRSEARSLMPSRR